MSVEDIKNLVALLRPDLADNETKTEIGKIPSLVLYCNMCKQDKASSFFYDKRGNRYQYCRTCRNEWQKRRVILAKLHPRPDNCESCGLPFQKTGPFRAEIDHCHDSNDYRGWLHACCNRGIGQFQNSIEMLEKAIEYLRQREKYVTLNEVLNRR